MKKTLFISALAFATITLFSCSSKTENGEGSQDAESNETTEKVAEEAQPEAPQVDAWPWDFKKDISIDVKEGQLVLAPYTFYPIAIRDGKDLKNQTLIFYKAYAQTVGNGTVTLDGSEIPNALVIPIPEGEKVSKGDVVLTWWQSGSGLKRAYVTGGSATEPTVNYLDMSYEDENSFGWKNKNEALKPNTFVKLAGDAFEPGAQLAINKDGEWKTATLIHENDGKVIVLGFADKVEAYDKADCKVVSLKQNFKAGEEVMVRFLSSYKDGYTVKKFDKANGVVTVVDKNNTEKVVPMTEVTYPL